MTDPRGLTRRQFTDLGLASVLALLVSCGSDEDTTAPEGSGHPAPPGTGLARADVERFVADPALSTDVVAAADRFAAELYALAIGGVDNLAFSPPVHRHRAGDDQRRRTRDLPPTDRGGAPPRRPRRSACRLERHRPGTRLPNGAGVPRRRLQR